jgi:hypothetical protein
MPLMLVTGKPRNGKTLYVLANIKKWFPGRPVFYRRIDDLNKEYFGFQELTDDMMKKWWDLPTQSVIIMDECHYDFPSRMQGTPPEWIGRLTEHGHYGLDFILITQHPMNMDVFVRRLCQPYYIIKRIWGSQRAAVLRGDEYFDPDDKYARMNAEKSVFKYPKEIFGKYHSAEAHTVKRRIPVRAFVLAGVVASVVGLAVLSYRLVMSPAEKPAAGGVPGVMAKAAPAPASAGSASAPYGLIARTSMIPRDSYFPDSAPAFDKVRPQVTVSPRVAGCWSAGSGHCECRNQQGFKIAFTVDACFYHLARTFDPYAASPAPVPAARPSASGVAVAVGGLPPSGL